MGGGVGWLVTPDEDPVFLLRRYIEAHHNSAGEFARAHGLDAREIYKILRRIRGKHMTVKMAVRIEKATDGQVPVEAWSTI